MKRHLYTHVYGSMIHSWASLGAQTVKNLPAMQETRVQSLGWEDPLEKNANPLQYSDLENSMERGYNPWGCKELDTTELTLNYSQLPKIGSNTCAHRLMTK